MNLVNDKLTVTYYTYSTVKFILHHPVQQVNVSVSLFIDSIISLLFINNSGFFIQFELNCGLLQPFYRRRDLHCTFCGLQPFCVDARKPYNKIKQNKNDQEASGV